jgi:hypothetical protein
MSLLLRIGCLPRENWKVPVKSPLKYTAHSFYINIDQGAVCEPSLIWVKKFFIKKAEIQVRGGDND